MKPLAVISSLLVACFSPAATLEPRPVPASALLAPAGIPDFRHILAGYDGCFVIKSLNDGWTLRYNDVRCGERYAPCSTFKIFNALAGLDCGVLTGPDHELKWDGTPQNRKECAKDHTLATAIRDSVLWYFQNVASDIGADRMQKYLNACDYGNRDISAGIRTFWLQNSLTISANEQIGFLEKLYTGKLPFGEKAVRTVKEIIVQRQSNDWVFSGKTGTGGKGGQSDEAVLGWFVGHVKVGERQYVFATNIAGPNAMGRKARELTAAMLRAMGLIEYSGSFE